MPTSDLVNIFNSYFANMFKSDQTNIFTCDLNMLTSGPPNIFTTDLAKMFVSKLRGKKKKVLTNKSLVKLIGKDVNLYQEYDTWSSLPQITVDIIDQITIPSFVIFTRNKSLTHFRPIFPFYIPLKRQKTFSFLTFSGGIERDHGLKGVNETLNVIQLKMHNFSIQKLSIF